MNKTILLPLVLTAFLISFPTISQADDASFTVGSASARPGEANIEVPITVSGLDGTGTISIDIQLDYDADRLSFSSLNASNMIAGVWDDPIYNSSIPGQIKIALYGTQALSGQGTLLKVYFNVKAEAASGSSALTLVRAKCNDGSTITSTLNNGTFTVISQNYPPVLNPVENQNINEAEALIFNISASDPDDDSLTYAAAGLPANASFNTSTGAFSFTPSYAQAGTYAVTFSVDDGNGGTDSGEVTITVGNINQAPLLGAIGNKTVDEGRLLQFTLSAEDPDGDNLTYSAIELPQGALFDPATRVFSWQPNYTQYGNHTVVFFVTDSILEDSETITVTVGNVNQPPVLTAIGSLAVDEGKGLNFQLSAADEDGDTLTYAATGLPEGAVLTGTGEFSYAPGYADSGVYKVTFTVSDGLRVDSEDVVIRVANVIRKYRLAMSAENGSVAREPAYILYDENTVVNLTATAKPGYAFSNWSGDLSGKNNPAVITIDGDKSVAAVFVDSTAPDECSVMINKGAEYVNSPNVILNISGRDLGSGLSKMQFSNDGINWSSLSKYNGTADWTLSEKDGVKTVYARLVDTAGNTSALFSASIILDNLPPQAPEINPVAGRTREVELRMSGTKEADSGIFVNGLKTVPVNNKTEWSCVIKLKEGRNVLRITAQDNAGNESNAVTENVTLKTKVDIRIISPVKKFLGSADLTSEGRETAILYLVDEETAPRVKMVSLKEGKEVKFVVSAEDELGNKGEQVVELGLYLDPPRIDIENYQDGQTVASSDIVLKGKVYDSGCGIEYVRINGQPARVSGSGFNAGVKLSEGQNRIVIISSDKAGNEGSLGFNLNYQTPSVSVVSKEEISEGTPDTVIHSPMAISALSKPMELKQTDISKSEVQPQKQQNVRQNSSMPEASTQKSGSEGQAQQDIQAENPALPENNESGLKLVKLGPAHATEQPEEIKAEVLIGDKIVAAAGDDEEVVISAKKIRGLPMFREYKIEAMDKRGALLDLKFSEKQKLPFGLRINRDNNTVYGLVFEKKDVALALKITHSQDRLEEAQYVFKME